MPEIQVTFWFRSIRSFYLVLVITVHPHVKVYIAVSALVSTKQPLDIPAYTEWNPSLQETLMYILVA